MTKVTADDNGAYIKTRKTIKHYFNNNGKFITAHEENGRFYINQRASSNSYSKLYVDKDQVVALHRNYGKAKSFPLNRTV